MFHFNNLAQQRDKIIFHQKSGKVPIQQISFLMSTLLQRVVSLILHSRFPLDASGSWILPLLAPHPKLSYLQFYLRNSTRHPSYGS